MSIYEEQAKNLIKTNPSLTDEIYRQVRRARYREDIVSYIAQNPNDNLKDLTPEDLDNLAIVLEKALQNNDNYSEAFWENVSQIVAAEALG